MTWHFLLHFLLGTSSMILCFCCTSCLSCLVLYNIFFWCAKNEPITFLQNSTFINFDSDTNVAFMMTSIDGTCGFLCGGYNYHFENLRFINGDQHLGMIILKKEQYPLWWFFEMQNLWLTYGILWKRAEIELANSAIDATCILKANNVDRGIYCNHWQKSCEVCCKYWHWKNYMTKTKWRKSANDWKCNPNVPCMLAVLSWIYKTQEEND